MGRTKVVRVGAAAMDEAGDVGPTSSPLTQLLHSRRTARETLLHMRDYEGARALRDGCFEAAAAHKERSKEQIRQQHDVERERLTRARSAAMQQCQAAAAAAVAAARAAAEERAMAHDARRAARAERYEQRVRATEAKRPFVHSTNVRDLLQAERRLAEFHQYDEAAAARRKIGGTEDAERRAAAVDSERRVQRAMRRLDARLNDDHTTFEGKTKNDLVLAARRAQEEAALVRLRYRHAARDMHHAHALELQANPLLANLQRPPELQRKQQIKADLGAGPRPGATAFNGGQRGTQCLIGVVGSIYEPPSLCDLYGHALRQQGAGVALPSATRMGSDRSPTKSVA
jgi:hypothetical protein